MIYAIIGIFVIVALFLIFREDHDNSYDKSEKGSRKKASKNVKEKTQTFNYQKEQPKAEQPKVEQPKGSNKKSGTSLKDQIIGEIEAALGNARKDMEEPMAALRDAMDMAKNAIDNTVREAQKGWNANFTDVDVQEQPEPDPKDWEDEEDLSFLDTLDYYHDLADNTETFDIAGLRYHCTVHDCGKIVGYVKPDPSNVHDNRAQAVIRSDGKLLGYIPRTQQDWYEDFNEHNVICPFVGEIELDRSSARLIAEIKVIIPSSKEFVLDEIECG